MKMEEWEKAVTHANNVCVWDSVCGIVCVG